MMTQTAARKEFLALASLALPIIMTGLADMAINFTDVLMMGWLGPQAIAAGILGAHFYAFLHFFGVGVLAAVAPLVAQSLGARRFRHVRRSVRQGLWAAVTIFVFGALMLLQAGSVLLALGQDSHLVGLSVGYLDVRGVGLLPGLVFLVLSNFLAAHSRPRAIMVVSLAAIGLNALGNYVLMFGHFGLPRLELIGAGISSAAVDTFAAASLLAFVLIDRRFKRYHILARFWRPDWPRYREIFSVGLPIAGAVLSEAGLFLASTLLVGRLGEAQLAGHAVAVQCASVAYMIPLGLGQAATVRVGLAVGMRDAAGVRRAGRIALVSGVAFMMVPALAFWLWPKAIANIYLDVNDPVNHAALGHAATFLAIAAIFQLVDGAQCMANGALRGLKDTRLPMLLAVFSYWGLGFTAAWWFGFVLEFGGAGIWAGLALGLGAAAVLLNWRFSYLSRRLVF